MTHLPPSLSLSLTLSLSLSPPLSPSLSLSHPLSYDAAACELFFSHSLEKVWKSLALVQVGIAGTTLSLSLFLTHTHTLSLSPSLLVCVCVFRIFLYFPFFLKTSVELFCFESHWYSHVWYLNTHNVRTAHALKLLFSTWRNKLECLSINFFTGYSNICG